jgi:hypothetical protein
MATPGGRSLDGAIVGSLLVLLGGLALGEAWRLHGLRTEMVAGAVVGDDTFPFAVGAALVALGVATVVVRRPVTRVSLPRGRTGARMVASAGILAAYAALVPHAGYTGSTALASVALFRVMGGYRWGPALLLAAGATGMLHLLFRVWLRQPLPTGWLGP